MKTKVNTKAFEGSNQGGLSTEAANPSILRLMQHAEQVSSIRSGPFRYGLIGVLGVSLLGAMISTRSWPLVGDAALMHYVVFLLKGGAIPYRQIIDINLPGTYLFERSGMALFGTGARGLRLYDWSLLTAVAVACLGLTGRRQWFAGLFSGLFFALVHLQDGIAQQGQRDLLMAALLLGGLGAFRLLVEETSQASLAALGFGLAFGVSFTLKPVFLPLAVFALLLGFFKAKALRSPAAFGLAIFGLLSPSVLMTYWLYRKGALRSFLAMSHALLPLHALLGRRSIAFLLAHSFSPLGVLLLCCVALMIMARASFVKGKLIVIGGLAGTLLAYVLQGKGYPYQRYPFLVMLLIAIGMVLDKALDAPGQVRVLAMVTVCWAGGLGMYFAWRSTTYEVQTPVVSALASRLSAFGSPDQLTGDVQCLDTFGGCVNTLYDLGIRQSTGFLYDCYLFTDASAERDAYREQFWAAFQKAKPRLVVVSSQNCFKNFTSGYDRFASWPALADNLREQYHVVSTWAPTKPILWFSQKQMPSGFKLLLRDR